MSICITATCPHERGVFIWLGDGPAEDGSYPWVHDTTMNPGHLEVCDRMPFATAAEAGQVCACGHESRVHSPDGLVPVGRSARSMLCQDCDCEDFRHRPSDLERERLQSGRRHDAPRAAESTPPPPEAPDDGEGEQLELFPPLQTVRVRQGLL